MGGSGRLVCSVVEPPPWSSDVDWPTRAWTLFEPSTTFQLSVATVSPCLAASVLPEITAAPRLPQEVRVVRCFLCTPEAREQMLGTLSEWHPRAPWASHTQ